MTVTREERLLGAQVLEKISIGNAITHSSAYVLQNMEPFYGEKLDLSVIGIKGRTAEHNQIITLEVGQRLHEFVRRFNDNKAINRGLEKLRISRQDVDRDTQEVLTHADSVQTVNVLIHDFEGLQQNGKFLSLYKEAVELDFVVEHHINMEDEPINQYQDILNAISLELQGICSYRGDLRYATLSERIPLVESRLRVALMLQEKLPSSEEIRGFKRACRDLALNLPDVTTEEDAKALGLSLAAKVPQLPLLRRWWNFK